jgi:hypothetical protein
MMLDHYTVDPYIQTDYPNLGSSILIQKLLDSLYVVGVSVHGVTLHFEYSHGSPAIEGLLYVNAGSEK